MTDLLRRLRVSTTSLLLVAPGFAATLTNLSVRTAAGTGAQTLTVGFAVAGEGGKPVLLRAVGPALSGFGVPGTLANPALQVFSGPAVIAGNDDWGAQSPGAGALGPVFSAAGAFALPAGSADAALLQTLPPGPYTMQVSGAGAATGLALAELYDTDSAGRARLANVSARAKVGTGDGVLIAGLVVGGNTTCRLLARVVGPTLSTLGVSGALADPTVELYGPGSATPIASNDDWGSVQATVVGEGLFRRVGAFDLPAGSKDSVIVARVQPGAYTLVAQGKGTAQGEALIEIYLID
mgnify:CR=1 FL=1